MQAGMRQKRLVAAVVVALVVVLAGTARAQPGSSSGEARAQQMKPVRYGLTMGLNLSAIIWPNSWMTDMQVDDRLAQPSMRFAGEVEFAVSPALSIASGVGFRMTGEKYHVLWDPPTWTTRMGNNLTIPVLLKYKAGKTLGVRPFVKLGPQALVLLSFYGMDEPSTMKMEMMQYVRRATLELRGGAGFEFPMSGMMDGVLEVEYEYPLTSYVKKELDNPAKMRNLSFSMGVRF